MFDVYSQSRRVPIGDLEIVVTHHGPADGTPVLLLHGFPDSARLWRHQIPALTEAGYRVLAPDLPGLGRSDRPDGLDGYKLSRVATDMIAVLDEAGIDRAHVVGHDWGAAASWFLAISAPERIHGLVALSAGHPSAFQNAGMRQVQKSWYMLFFQFEGVAESWLSQDDWHGLREWTGSHPEIDHWIEDLSRPGALSAALNYYRANAGPERFLAPPLRLPAVEVPALGVWSSGDVALTEQQMTDSEQYVSGEWRYERLDGASHWIPVDVPDHLNSLLLEWLGDH